MDANRDCCVNFRACDLLKQFRALALSSEKEGVEFALSEKHRSPELIECEIGSRFHGLANLGLASSPLRCRHQVETMRAAHSVAAHLPGPRAIGFPADAVALTIMSDEIHLGISAAGASAKDRAAVMNGYRFSAGIRSIFPPAYRDARIFAIERKAQRIKNSGLPGASLACDGEEAGTRERLRRQINFKRRRETSQIFAANGQDAHGLRLRARVMENIQMRGIRRHAECAFERKLEHILWISFRQPDQRIGDNRFRQCASHRSDPSIDQANRKALGDAVDLLPKSGRKPVTSDPTWTNGRSLIGKSDGRSNAVK